LVSDGSILVLGRPKEGTRILRFAADGTFVRKIPVDINKPSSFMYYEPEGPKSGLYAAVDHETNKMFVWSIGEETTALTRATAKKAFDFPFKTGARAVKGYDPVSKMFFIFKDQVLRVSVRVRVRVRASESE
jgi:hypothetical protein